MAGATDLYPAAGELPLKGAFVDVSRLSDLKGIKRDGDEIRIGAATTWTEIVRAELGPAFSALQESAREVGAGQIQNRGTIGGNLCNASPAADGVPPLLILDAEVELVSHRGARRLRLADFITGNRRNALAPGEIMSAIFVPAQPPGARSIFLKFGARRYLVISIAMIAVLLETENGVVSDARLAIGACSAVARRLPQAERAMIGRPVAGLAQSIAAEHLAELSPIDDIRATASYRRDAALTLARRAIEACAAGETGGAA